MRSDAHQGHHPDRVRLRPIARTVLQLALALGPVLHSGARADEPSGAQLVEEDRNPLSDQASLQVQPNFEFRAGEDGDTGYVFDLQPVVPIDLPGAWTLLSRTVAPLIDEPASEPGESYTFGVGDIEQTLFVSPPSSKAFIWGAGPVIQFPSASSTRLGTGKWEMGPAAAAILTGDWWQVGVQANNEWSFAGDSSRSSVNTMLLEPLLNIFLPDEWYLTFEPNVTADWKAGSRDRWTVPVGGGIGTGFTIGQQTGTAQIEAYSNVERPVQTSTWSLVLSIQLVFPRCAPHCA